MRKERNDYGKSHKPREQICVCVGVVKNKEAKILLARRSEVELPEVHGRWGLPGGKVEFGETPEEALKREIYEETAYHVKVNNLLPHPFVSCWSYPAFYQHTIILGFNCNLIEKTNGKNIFANDDQVSDVKWFSRKQISSLDLLPGVMHFIKQS